ncbi:hypothetical protein [Geotalea uraniireducens]|uniref:Toxin-antitoxin system protein n=1 Tax=Geotalea uraniireducens (strain Rf4) TaxID=351605 RepID=A5GFF5_GEOUR|nr:hypothetical protein [Geotalea uraniireducens]ABQ26160.1 hypothetical protein Gura_1970 [Geotalea uraniireducens Rf4]
MATATVRISESARQALREIARHDKKPMQTVLEQAIEFYHRKCFLEDLASDFAVLRENGPEWQAELEERSAWDAVQPDGGDK